MLQKLVCDTFALNDSVIASPIRAICIDSRQIQKDDLFFALSGSATDGHYFLHEVAKGGARAAVIASDYMGPIPKGLPVIRVKDTLLALQMLAKAAIASCNATKIAITGSVGKTTTKEFVSAFLRCRSKVLQTEGNQNSQIGLAVSLLNNFQGDENYIVAEMGMTQPGHIPKLTKIVPPQVALITRVELVHAQNFESIEKIAEAKAEIFGRDETTACIYNADSPCAGLLAQRSKGGRAFSMNGAPNAFWHLEVLDDALVCMEGEEKFVLPKPNFLARHVYENLLAAIAVARTVQVSWEDIKETIPTLRLLRNRLEKIEVRDICFINDSYNASEVSMISALSVLGNHSPSRRIAVLGRMGELGPFSDGCHKRVGEHALKNADLLFCLGEECAPMIETWRKEKKDCFWTYSLTDLIDELHKRALPGDVVLLKGSRTNCLWKVVEHFLPK
jgi:UDP-N-acetylmuramoyl-tripeptide--D-alanyl-D-alanine ligase